VNWTKLNTFFFFFFFEIDLRRVTKGDDGPSQLGQLSSNTMSRIKESKKNLQNRGEEEEEKVLIRNINLVSLLQGKD
jgi:hypothetical protein